MENQSNSAGGAFAAAFENEIASAIESIRPRRIVKGTAIEIDKDFVHVDVGYKSIGVVAKEEFLNIDDEMTAKVGDEVDVYIVALENEHNQIVLSHERANQLRIWKEVEDKFANGGVVTGKVQHKVKGGLQVDIGIPAFLPGSQVDLKPHKNLDKFTGERFDFRVLKITKDKGNIVVSRKALLMSEREELRAETLKAIGEGVILEGTVKNITDYGAFVDLGGIDGLLHITDITWGHIEHPADKLSVGQKLAVVVTSYDQEKQRVSLGMKQLTDDPWKEVPSHFTESQKITGKVAAIADHGLHIVLEEGIEGFLHRDDISWTKKTKNFGKDYTKGQELETMITKIDIEERKISLSLKHLGDNPWETLHERHAEGSTINGEIRSITDFGLFVAVEDGIDGLVRPGDISWTDRYRDASALKAIFKEGEKVDAQVMDIDAKEERLSLSIKALATDPWPEIVQRYPVGAKVKGTVAAVADFGVFVQLEEGVQGMIHKSELGMNKKSSIAEAFEVGSDIECLVISVDPDSADRRIGLSIRAARQKNRDEQIANFNDEVSAPTFGDLIKEQLEGE